MHIQNDSLEYLRVLLSDSTKVLNTTESVVNLKISKKKAKIN